MGRDILSKIMDLESLGLGGEAVAGTGRADDFVVAVPVDVAAGDVDSIVGVGEGPEVDLVDRGDRAAVDVPAPDLRGEDDTGARTARLRWSPKGGERWSFLASP